MTKADGYCLCHTSLFLGQYYEGSLIGRSVACDSCKDMYLSKTVTGIAFTFSSIMPSSRGLVSMDIW